MSCFLLINIYKICLFSSSFYSQLAYIIIFEVNFFQAACSWVIFLIYSANLLLIGIFRSFIFNVIIDMLRLKSDILFTYSFFLKQVFKKNYLFIYFWLHWVFVAACGLSLVVAGRVYALVWCAGFSLQWLLFLWSMGSRHVGFSSFGTWAQQFWLMGPRVQAQQLWRTGLVVPRHVGSSRTRARTCVSCIGRQILNHCTTREVPVYLFYSSVFFSFSYSLRVT